MKEEITSPVKAIRFGKNPYTKRAELTEAQKAEMRKHLARARAAKEQQKGCEKNGVDENREPEHISAAAD